jgi:ribonuclease-3
MAGRFSALEKALGYAFKRASLLEEALTHSSAANSVQPSYERLEFLGDRVLSLAVAELLFESFPNEAEGELARRHAVLARRDTVARVALGLDLGKLIDMAKSDEDSGGRANPTTLGDAMEAVIGALYLDGGLPPARDFVRHAWQPLMSEDLTPPKDAKTALQEWTQARGLGLPTYSVAERTGPAHDPKFVIEASVGGHGSARGEGGSKRMAEQAAAQLLLERLSHG